MGDQADRNALAYLQSAHAAALTIRQDPSGNATLTISTRDLGGAARVFWTQEEIATELVRTARHNAGVRPDVMRLVDCLRQAAEDRRASLTDHETAMARARAASHELDVVMLKLQESRLLRIFNATYARYRLQAKREGKGYMAYRVVLGRLRRELAMILSRGGTVNDVRLDFARLFKPGPLVREKSRRPVNRSNY
jgi:hypothetical protein